MFKKLMQLPKIVISISMLFSSFGFNFIKVNASEIDFLKSSINEQYDVIYDSDDLSKINVTNEYEKYTIIIDNINDKMVVNNLVYTLEDFASASKKQLELEDGLFLKYLSEYNSVKSDIDYNKLYEDITKPIVHEEHDIIELPGLSTCCNLCGLDPYNAPTTGYSTTGHAVSIENFPFTATVVLTMTVAMIATYAKKIKASNAVAKDIMVNLLKLGVAAGTQIAGGRTIRQYYHNRCPKAVKTESLARGSAKGYTVTYTVTSTGYTYFDNPF